MKREKLQLTKIISGGQTGADQGGLLAGKDLGLETGGTAPRGFITEEGSNIVLNLVFGLSESNSTRYIDRTITNVRDSDGTVIFGDPSSVGSKRTIRTCKVENRPISPFT